MNMFEWATSLIEDSGYMGVALAMILENIFPPIPSELVMAFSGAAAGRGELNIFLVILFGSIGSVIGLIPWYYAGRLIGEEALERFAEKHGRLLTLTRSSIEKADRWFNRHRRSAVAVSRFLPAIRTLIAVPAGAYRMSIVSFLLFALIGSLVYDSAFAALGYALGENYESLERYVNIGTGIVVGAIIVYYFYRVFTFKNMVRS